MIECNIPSCEALKIQVGLLNHKYLNSTAKIDFNSNLTERNLIKLYKLTLGKLSNVYLFNHVGKYITTAFLLEQYTLNSKF